MPTATPFNVDTFKDIAGLIGSPKAEWMRVFGEPVRELPPGNTMPRDAGETHWDYDTFDMEVSWLQTKSGVLPWDIEFVPINGEPNMGLLELDLIAHYFGLSRSKTNDNLAIMGGVERRLSERLV